MQRIKYIFKAATVQDDDLAHLLHDAEKLSPNMRALRLAIAVSDILVGSGVAVSDVVSMALDVTDRYCKRKVSFDISSSLIIASQDRGNDLEPLTMVRHARPRTPNLMLVQSVQELVRDIGHGQMTLGEAEERFDTLTTKPKKYPFWLMAVGGALISAGVGVTFGASPTIVTIMFVLGAFVSYILRWLSHFRVPAFFAQVFSAIIVTLVAAGVSWLGAHEAPLFAGINPNYIVIGGIILLVVGVATVSAVQDAIDEYYVTANARLLRAVMATAGIVAGVLIGLYSTQALGTPISIDSATPGMGHATPLLIGAVIVSVGYAMTMQSRPASILAAGGTGALAWIIYAAIADGAGFSAIAASGIAAAVVGGVSTLISRFWRTPSAGLIMAGIVPLVPGLMLYTGLRQVAEASVASGDILAGGLTLFNALLTAISVASGASFGVFVARPLRRTLVRARNAIPRQRLHSRRSAK